MFESHSQAVNRLIGKPALRFKFHTVTDPKIIPRMPSKISFTTHVLDAPVIICWSRAEPLFGSSRSRAGFHKLSTRRHMWKLSVDVSHRRDWGRRYWSVHKLSQKENQFKSSRVALARGARCRVPLPARSISSHQPTIAKTLHRKTPIFKTRKDNEIPCS